MIYFDTFNFAQLNRMNLKSTNSWGFKKNNKWDGIVGLLNDGEADFSIIINAIKSERFEAVEYMAISTLKHQ